MKLILVILCLILSGCSTVKKDDSSEINNLQLSMIQHTEQSRQSQITWEDQEFNRCLNNKYCRERMGMTVEEKVKHLISEQLCVDLDKVTPEARFVEDLGADSLDLIELVMYLEEDLQIEIPDEDAKKLETVNDAILYCKAKTEGNEN